MKILRRYKYDPLDRLAGLQAQEQAFTQRFYQENDLVTELGEEDQQSIFRHREQPLMQRQILAGATDTLLLATDQAHSVLQTLSPTRRERMAYSAYGHRPAESGLSSLLGFNGECLDGITGHYLLGQGKRAFNPVLMRFNSPDELSPFGEGGINPYAYCGNDPINFSDPTGNAKLALIQNIARPSVIVKNPLFKIKSTATTISRSSQQERNPMLNRLLSQSTSNPQTPLQKTSTSTSELVSIQTEFPSTENLLKHIPAEIQQEANYKNLKYTGKVFDNYKSTNSGFETVATVKQHKAIFSHAQRKSHIQNDVNKMQLHKQNKAELLLQIKQTSVMNHQAKHVRQ
jgi:RHS repeat-associated protein